MENTEQGFILPTKNLRSTFLTVLCILTFIGAGLGVVQSIRGYATADAQAEKVSEAMAQAQDKLDSMPQNGFLSKLFSSAQNMDASAIRKSSIFGLISCLLRLLGAILMWNLRKNGYIVYVVGVVLEIVAPLIVLGTGMIGLASSGGAAIFGIAFIAMYGANYKYLTK